MYSMCSMIVHQGEVAWRHQWLPTRTRERQNRASVRGRMLHDHVEDGYACDVCKLAAATRYRRDARARPITHFRASAALVCIEYELLHVTARPNQAGRFGSVTRCLSRPRYMCRRARMLGFIIRIVLGTQLASGKSGPRNSYPRQIIRPFAVHPDPHGRGRECTVPPAGRAETRPECTIEAVQRAVPYRGRSSFVLRRRHDGAWL